MKKIIGLFLLLCILSSSFFSCNGEPPSEVGSKLPSTDADWFHNLDFGGKTIAVRYQESASMRYTKGPDSRGSDSVLDRCYDRNLSVKVTLNLKVDQRVGNNSVEYMNEIALMPESAPDFVLRPNSSTISMALQGYIRNAKKAPADKASYYDFTKSCWLTEFMEGFALDDTKYFALAGDYFLDVLRQAECLYMNTNYFKEKMTDSLEDFYVRIERGNFNADYMQYMVELAYEDRENQGAVDHSDRLGLIWRHGISFNPWVYGADASVFAQDENGEWQLIDNPTAFYDVVEKLLSLCLCDGATGTGGVGNNIATNEDARSFIVEKFVSNDLLFASMFRIGDLEHSKMLTMDHKIAVVYPIIDPDQTDYRTTVYYGAEVGMIPVQAKENFTEVSAYIQLLNEQSPDIVRQYYEESLKFKYSTEAVGAGRMLDVIYDSIVSTAQINIQDAARDESGITDDRVLPRVTLLVTNCISKQQNSFHELWAAYRELYRSGLENLKQKYAALGE